MRINYFKAIFTTGVCAAAVLLLGAAVAHAQQQINLTAGSTSAILPDGSSVPMWGYSCGAAEPGSTASCAPLNLSAGGGWSPVVITVPSGQGLAINLTNSLPAPVPTSIVIAGQLSDKFGTTAQDVAGPNHDHQGTTWPIPNSGSVFVPPVQGARVQSFSTEVTTGKTTSLTWSTLSPGTYLIESGTHPSIQGPMGLYGILVVTTAPSSGSRGIAYDGVNYDSEIPLLFSEIDPVQNRAVNAAVNSPGFSESATYGISTGGPVASINVTNGGSGYTSAPTVKFSPTGAQATAVVDTTAGSPTYGQVTEIDIDSNNAGNYSTAPKITIDPPSGGTTATATAALPLKPNGSTCVGPSGPLPAPTACYPPVVNYTPLYYTINGVAFDKTHGGKSLFPTSPASVMAGTGQVLVRMVNAGLRMHVPSIVGSQTGPQPYRRPHQAVSR